MAKTFVYKNLHRDVWSLMNRGLVVSHEDHVVMEGCEFVVRPAGRGKVLRERKKNVHAFVKGYPIDAEKSTADGGAREVVEALRLLTPVQITYHPYRKGSFYRIDTAADVVSADYVELRKDSTVWAWGIVEKR